MNINILIIEDNPGDAFLVKQYLIDSKFKEELISIAGTLTKGIEIIESREINLILLDLGLPDYCNEETIKIINDFTKKIPVIVLSGNDDENLAVKAVNYGIQDYLIKGKFDAHSLSRAIKYSLLRSEQELKLYELNNFKNKLFRLVSHDLKGPMGALNSYIEIILEDFEESSKESLKESIVNIEDISKSLLHLIENLFNWARMQMGSIEVKPEKINVHDLVEENIKICQLQLQKKNIRIINKTEENLTAYADLEMIKTVIRNLMFNSIKFTENNGLIEIGGTVKNGNIQIDLSDNGIGIEENHLATIFEGNGNYVRQGTNREKGSGFGLSLCKDFIEHNNGKIWVTSKIYEGSTFHFSLPQN